MFEPTFCEAEGRAPLSGGKLKRWRGECLPAGRQGWGHSRACPELVEGLPLKYSSNFFVKRPQIGKRQRCARRGSGRGERIKASQRGKLETAAG
ncbi:hypothetical protein A2773_01115 [Candidatus Gottesmanbacteria bacterium RIFCSPHIGHO2_01_FULL_39_10]|uniref:Uncharacterized protein n=1 Tax=Candidatus Gottesmanbacteria bacterium RIFCSPHIGHO2_01_FULL_39_10 TaxID=1798375 RepID=A0A1F5ZL14_9BACT|nr:MAG: hypothetical protein A2773_01115 [Candidatus Gottesmanbacteria bacterium RIFCSPHIGHO2_01_FULL_39_10]